MARRRQVLLPPLSPARPPHPDVIALAEAIVRMMAQRDHERENGAGNEK